MPEVKIPESCATCKLDHPDAYKVCRMFEETEMRVGEFVIQGSDRCWDFLHRYAAPEVPEVKIPDACVKCIRVVDCVKGGTVRGSTNCVALLSLSVIPPDSAYQPGEVKNKSIGPAIMEEAAKELAKTIGRRDDEMEELDRELTRVENEISNAERFEEFGAEVGRKDDDGKLRWDLLPVTAVERMLEVMQEGAKKYGDNNWRLVENGKRRYLNAAMRHLADHLRGEKINHKDFGLTHLAHAMTNVAFLIELEEASN